MGEEEVFVFFKRYTPKFKDNNGNELINSVAEVKRIELGEIKQYIMIRGKNKENPILLFLHGGPGFSHIPFVRKFQNDLEDSFTVVNWDQRGAGLSYSNQLSEETMNLEQFISDTYELIIYLLEELNKEKIYLAGHSWGSYLGILMVERYPELFYAYVGISQVVDIKKASNLEYLHILGLAEKNNNQKAIKELKSIGSPIYKEDKQFKLMRKWFNYYEGSKELNLTKIAFKGILFNSEYKIFDLIKYIRGLNFSQSNMTEAVYKNLFKHIKSLEIPIYFCSGVHDYTTPSKLVKSYLEILSAPKKHLYIFEKSAHCPHLHEPKKFNNIMNSIRKDITLED